MEHVTASLLCQAGQEHMGILIVIGNETLPPPRLVECLQPT